MKGLAYLVARVLVVLLVLPIGFVYAQTSPTKLLPQVPITYPGDTDKTILRRAQWIEGAKKEGTLEWWSVERPDQLKKIVAEFNKIYPFITGSYWRASEEIAPKLESEYASGRFTVDIIHGGQPHNYPRWRKMGILDKITDVILGIQNIDKRMYSKYGDWVQLGSAPKVPMYNTKLLAPAEAPKTWEDLLNSKWKGQIGLTRDVMIWYTLALAEGGWGIEKTEEFLRKLRQQEPIWASGNTAGHNLLMAGEYKIMGADNLHRFFESQKKGAPLGWIKVRPVPVTGSSLTLQKNAPHPHSARLFIEWLYSPQGLATFEKVTGFGFLFPGSQQTKALEGLPLVYRTEESVLKAAEMGLDKKFAALLGLMPE